MKNQVETESFNFTTFFCKTYNHFHVSVFTGRYSTRLLKLTSIVPSANIAGVFSSSKGRFPSDTTKNSVCRIRED